MMKNFRLLVSMGALIAMVSCADTELQAQQVDPGVNGVSQVQNDSVAKIRMAILFDTSNSMDGLIDKAKSQLWELLNRMTEFKKEGRNTVIEVALYHYGNSSLPSSENYIRQLTPFTSDMDEVSRLLFALKTNGGEEYCGAVIDRSLKELDWLTNQKDLEVIFIAGNEPFNQGGVNYQTAAYNAIEKGVYINTIYCGAYQTGLSENWKKGADAGKGVYANIDHNQSTHYVASPYDDSIQYYNIQLNNTYIYYGAAGASKSQNMVQQDANATSVSAANQVQRAKFKSSKAYKNDDWDLVDKMEADQELAVLDEVEASSLPTEYQGKSKDEIKAAVKEKSAERQKNQEKITELTIKREAYVRKQSGDVKNEFVEKMMKALTEQASSRGFAKS